MERLTRIYRFYRDGFREMTVGRVLWLIILIKLFVIFVVLKLLFFPSVMSRFETEAQKSEYMLMQLTDRNDTNPTVYKDNKK